MHPILEERGRLAAYLLGWLVVGALLAAAPWASGQAGLGDALRFVLPLAILFGFICLATWYTCRVLPLRSTGTWRLLATHLTSALLASALWVAVGFGWARALGARHFRSAPYLYAAGVLLYLLAVAVHYLFIAFAEARAGERRALELQVTARESELRALRAQINPHFLFNSLNSVSALTAADPAGARRMCLLLADFLRLTVRLGSHERVRLADELALLANYLEIERVRFGARLQVTEEVEEAARGCLVPALILQPLVENAIRHGVGELVDGGQVRCAARVEGGRLLIALENRCDPDRVRGGGEGVGLANVRRRLQAVHGDAAELWVGEEAERFRVELRLPAEHLEAL
jgi:hypothetical protein